MGAHQLRSEINQYVFSPGLVSHRRLDSWEMNPKTASEDPSGNGVLYTAIYFLTLKKLGALTEEDLARFRATIRQCYKPGTIGLVMRSPRKPDQEGPDDYVGASAVDKYIAQEILTYGVKYPPLLLGFIPIPYVFNTEQERKFTFKAWLGRQVQLIAHWKTCAGRGAGLFSSVWWAVVMWLGTFKDERDNDGWMLSWLLSENTPRCKIFKWDLGEWFFCRWARNYWRVKAQEKFGDRVQGMAARCLEPGHPIGKYFVF